MSYHKEKKRGDDPIAKSKQKNKSSNTKKTSQATTIGVNKGFFMKQKKRLTFDQEFEIMKLVLDKFLWLGFGIMAFGLYIVITSASSIYQGFSFMIIGAIVLLLFMILILREYEVVK